MKTTKTTKTDNSTLSKEPKDKRTKAYKEWKKNYDESQKGLGSQIEKITEKTGIKSVVKWLANGNDCGCDERRDTLNALFSGHKINCLEENEYIYLAETFGNRKNKITPDQQKRLLEIYNRVFNDKVQPTSCSPCFVNNIYKKLEKLYNKYSEQEN